MTSPPLRSAAPTRSTFHPGIYIAQLPGPLAKLDLRAEGSYTTSENPSITNAFNYWNSSYRDGYTNKGLLIGDTVGQGRRAMAAVEHILDIAAQEDRGELP